MPIEKLSLTPPRYAGGMTDLLIVAAPLLAHACLYCCWRAVSLIANRRPAVATVWRSDYGELDQLDDFCHATPLGTARGWELGDSEASRLIHDVVSFTDARGERHRAHVSRRVTRGWRPDSIYTVWYDPADPSRRVTAQGPGSWLLGALLAGGLLLWLFTSGASLVGTPA